MAHRFVNRSRSCGRFRRGIAAVVGLALVAGAAGAVAAADSPTAGLDGDARVSAADEPSRGGSAVMVMQGSVVSMDPSLHRVSFAFAEGAIMASVFGHLAFMNPETGEVEPYFLESLEPNEDSTVWTLMLHDGIKFSDGTPLDAEAIKFNIDRSADPETGSRFQPQAEVLGLEVVDELTLQVTLPEPNPAWDADFVANFAGVGSPTAIQAAIDEGVEVGTRPVGAGPFMLKDWDPGQTITVERNPYFEEFHPGRPCLDELTFENVGDRSQQVAAIQTGAAQIAGTAGGGPTEELLDTANAVVTATSGGSVFNFNTTIPPFDDVRARRALDLALDRSLLAEANAPGTPAVTNLFATTSPFYDPAFDLPAQDREEAQRLFDELAAEGTPLEFTLTATPTAQVTSLIDTMIAQLAEYDNVSFEPDLLTPPDYIAASTTGEYQVLSWGMYVINPMPAVYHAVLPDGYLNYGRWSNDVVAAALEDFETADTIEEQKAVWDVVQDQMLEDVPVLFVNQSIQTLGYPDDFIVPRAINLGTFPLWEEVGYR